MEELYPKKIKMKQKCKKKKKTESWLMALLSFINNTRFHVCFLFILKRQIFCGPGWKMPRLHPKDFLSFPSYQTTLIPIFSYIN